MTDNTEPWLPHEGASGFWGTVMAVQANFYRVQLPDPGQGGMLPTQSLLCTRRARLKKIGQQVMVGDRVWVEEPDWEGGRGAIAAIQPRRSQLDRPPVANADQILLVFALAEPDLDPHQLSRFLVRAELTELQVCLCLNKQDLIDASQQELWQKRLSAWGYPPLFISVQTEVQWPTLAAALQNRVTIVSGPSGVGKSSLINALIPAAQLRTSAVSGKLGRGRHTTRHVELFALPQGGLLADTPGFNQPDIRCHPRDLGTCFPEIQQRLHDNTCQFNNCLHQDEPHCAVRGDWERYPDYCALLEECTAQQQALDDSPDPDAALKTKTSGEGQIQHEPRLLAKKYRQVSRRSRQQSLQELRHTLTDTLENLEAMEEDTWE